MGIHIPDSVTWIIDLRAAHLSKSICSSSFCGQGGLLRQQTVPQGGQLLLICKNAPYVLMSVFNEDMVILYTDSSRMSTDSTLCPLTFALCPVW